MIKINNNGCEFKFSVNTELEKVMNTLSTTSFEKACITSDIRTLMECIDQKYGKGTALRMFGLASSHVYTVEDIEEADKEIDDYE